MIDNVFIEISLIVVLTLLVSFVFRLLKQPLVIAYIFSGILASPYFFDLVQSRHSIEAFAEIGIAILLFLVGIHLNPSTIKDVGKISLITGLGQVLFTSVIGFSILYMLGFSLVESLYVGIALTFSSTIIIMKLLSDKGDLDTLYGKISMGFLIVQDLVAMLILMVISSGSSSGLFSSPVATVVAGIVVIALFLLFGYYALPKIMPFVAKNSEFLLVFSIAWCLLAASLFYILGFSIEVGALLAGVTLSISPYRYEIGSLLKSMRDFFILMFFIFLGSQMVFDGITNLIFPIILLSAFVLIGNVFIVLILMTRMGYSSKVAFNSGLTVAQISEFSLILVAMGHSLGDISQQILSFVTIIGIITIAGSTYMILYSSQIYNYLRPYLQKFEKINLHSDDLNSKESFDIALIGAHRLGNSLLPTLNNLGSVKVIDEDPEIIASMHRLGQNCMYGDAEDEEFVVDSGILSSNTVVSTIPQKDTSLLLLKLFKDNHSDALKIFTAKSYEDALDLYSAGADYVIVPHYLASQSAKKYFEKFGLNANKFRIESKKQVEFLINRSNKEVDL